MRAEQTNAKPYSVPVPDNYDYYGDNSGNSRHDYCSNSPDSIQVGGAYIDLAGPCARHDLCYDEVDRRGGGDVYGYGGCNRRLRDDLAQLCDDAFPGNHGSPYPGEEGPRHPYWDCTNKVVAAYEVAVTGFHLGQNMMNYPPEHCYIVEPEAKDRRNDQDCLDARTNGQRLEELER